MIREIYLAGGCFWAMEKLFSMLNGVTAVTSGYANGNKNCIPTYESVCHEMTGFKETIHVKYDDKLTSLEALLFVYFSVIDPTIKNRQGFDKGHQYQTGIYYTSSFSKDIVDKITNIEKTGVKEFLVEIEPLKNYFLAEEFHQKYLLKNPTGYCHINPERMKHLAEFNITPNDYVKPAKEILRITI